MLAAHLLFSVVWAVGGALDGASRLKFDEFFRSVCDGEGSQAKHPRCEEDAVLNAASHRHHISVGSWGVGKSRELILISFVWGEGSTEICSKAAGVSLDHNSIKLSR